MVQASNSAAAEWTEVLEALYSTLGHLRRMAAPGPVDASSVFLLDMLRRCGAARPADLAARTGLDQSTISRKLRSLESQGYLRRLPDPADGRAWLVSVTGDGALLLRDKLDRLGSAMARAAADWNESDRAQLVALLRRLADDAAASDGHPHPHHLPNVNPNANATPESDKESA